MLQVKPAFRIKLDSVLDHMTVLVDSALRLKVFRFARNGSKFDDLAHDLLIDFAYVCGIEDAGTFRSGDIGVKSGLLMQKLLAAPRPNQSWAVRRPRPAQL